MEVALIDKQFAIQRKVYQTVESAKPLGDRGAQTLYLHDSMRRVQVRADEVIIGSHEC
jgi:hypothetical protein